MTRALAPVLLLALLAACGDDAPGAPDASPPAPPDATIVADGPPAPCGLEAPGTRCASSTLLERCVGTAVEEIDCAAQRDLCGPDPLVEGGETCISAGAACGVIGDLGACAGSVLAYCDGGRLVVRDCFDQYAECAWQDDATGHNCLTACVVEDVSVEGECAGAGIRRCVFEDGRFVVRTDACPGGTSCDTVPETGWPGCLPVGCPDLGPQGSCAGERLTRCDGGREVTTDCAAAGDVCAYAGDVAGYVCAAAGTMGALVVTGVVQYEDRPTDDGSAGAIVSRLVRGAAVAVVSDGDGAVLAAAVTANDGTYLLRYDAPPGAPVHLLTATTSTVATRRVRTIRVDGLVHGFASPSFAAAAMTTVPLLVTDHSGVAPAFNVFDMLVLGVDFAREALGVAAPAPVLAMWSRGTTDGTYYVDRDNGIYLLGASDDDDGYDDAVILHELGHWLEDELGRSDSPGGPHDGTPTDPRLAWSEGFSTWFSLAVRGVPTYSDSNAGGGWVWNAETSVTVANPSGDMNQQVGEDLISEILWDVSDAPAPDDDLVSVGFATQVLLVVHHYLTSVSPSRGRTGVDLVDWLDGWFVREGLGTCAGVRDIVTTRRSFPYDFSGPAGDCP